MKTCLILISFIVLGLSQNKDSLVIRKLFDEVLLNGQAYSMLDDLSNRIGPRISGSPQAASAVEYTYQKMKELKFDSVWLQEVMVPRWLRGHVQTAKIIKSDRFGDQDFKITALGGTIATDSNGLTAKVIEVSHFDELKKLGKKQIEGKIVFFNRRFDPREIWTFKGYGGAVDQRGQGAIEAAKLGAVAVIVRSMNPEIDDEPHTGGMRYDESVTKIPAVAISTKGAEDLSRMLKADPRLLFYLNIDSKWMPDVLSYNVIGDIRGSEFPNEVIVVGGHLDSWDNGDGAHDDGAGCVHSIEAARLFKAINYQPKRTIRVVMFMNEENGLRGGNKYAEYVSRSSEKHIAAIESDAGGFTPRGFGMTGSQEQLKKMRQWLPLLQPYLIDFIRDGGGGADIGPMQKFGIATIGFIPDAQRYFKYHHTAIDTFDKVNQRELEMGAGNISALLYLLSEYGF